MAKTEFKLIRKPKAPGIQRRIIRQEVIRKLKPVADASQRSYEKVVDNWENKPAFKTDIKVTTKEIEIITVVRRGQRLKGGSDKTTADLWRWIDKSGTKAHPIKAKKAGGKLAFKWGGKGSYKSKTAPNPARYGGPGTVSGGKMVFPKQVQHPGFKPRKFSEAINRDLRKKFNSAINAGYRAGFKKLKSS